MNRRTSRPVVSLSLVSLCAAGLVGCGTSGAAAHPVLVTEAHVAAPVTASDLTGASGVAHDGLLVSAVEASAGEAAEPPVSGPGWSLVQTTDAATHFVALDAGVLMSVGERHFVRGEDGALVDAPSKALTKGAPRGQWPDNAWVTATRSEERAGLYVRMSKWKGDKRWVPQGIKDAPETLWEDEGKWYETMTEFAGHVGGRGGYLFAIHDWDASQILFRRLAGVNYAPLDFAWDFDKEDAPLDIYEAPSGRLFVFSDGGETLRVDERPFCRQQCTVERHELPVLANDKALGDIVARDDDHITVGLKTNYGARVARWLLHGGEGSWTVDASPVAGGEFRRYLAGSPGELFAIVSEGQAKDSGEQLWHRDREGQWRVLPIPVEFGGEGPVDLDLARADDETVWVAFNRGEHHAVYAMSV